MYLYKTQIPCKVSIEKKINCDLMFTFLVALAAARVLGDQECYRAGSS